LSEEICKLGARAIPFAGRRRTRNVPTHDEIKVTYSVPRTYLSAQPQALNVYLENIGN
jgi:hypothetical protein